MSKHNEKYTKEILEDACKNSLSVMGVLRYLGIAEAGGNHSHISRKIKVLQINTDHFVKIHNKGKISNKRRTKENILQLRSNGRRQKAKFLRRAMTESGVELKCNICSQGNEWMGYHLTLDVDHKNDNWLDDRLENLQFLCPNCHSQKTRNNARVTE